MATLNQDPVQRIRRLSRMPFNGFERTTMATLGTDDLPSPPPLGPVARGLSRSSSDPGIRAPPEPKPLAFQIIAQARHFLHKERSNRRLQMSPQRSNRRLIPEPESDQGGTELSPLVTNVKKEGSTSEDTKDEQDTTFEALRDMIFGQWVSLLLVFMPFAILSHTLEWSPVAVFWFNFLTMIPLASILGDFTEVVAAHTNEVIGGLVNATFGNAVEVVVVIQALLANEIRVVQASMMGSIFSNLLLVLGTCFFCGGMIYKEQSFNTTAATANMSLLALSGIAMVLPTPFSQSYDLLDVKVLVISRFAAVFLMSMYLQLLIFQLRTHVHLFEGDGDAEPAQISLSVAVFALGLVTLLVALFSDYLVGSIDGFVQGTGVSRTFIGLIIIPIVGNAVEHVTAVSVAMKDKMDLAMGVAVGSCVQISLFVVPLSVMVGWATGKPMTLNFPQFEIVLFILSILTVQIILSNPKVNWLEGSLLITTYLMIAVGFWFENDVDVNGHDIE